MSFLWEAWTHLSKLLQAANCYKLQAAKRVNKPKVSVPQTQDPIALIGELVKVLNLYSNLEVGNHSNVNTNSNTRGASKKFWMQKTQTN